MAAVLEDPRSQLTKLAGTSEPGQEVSREIDHFDSTELAPSGKRRMVAEADNQNKKLCVEDRPEDQTENSAERNGSDSSLFVNSNGPSTSTKPASIPQSVTAGGTKDPVEEKEKNSFVGEEEEPAGAKEKVKDSGEEPEKEGEIDETTSKLLASGISISLIKKKKSQTVIWIGVPSYVYAQKFKHCIIIHYEVCLNF